MVSAIVSVSVEVSMEGDEERKKEGSGMVGRGLDDRSLSCALQSGY